MCKYKRVLALYFSATHTTKTVVEEIAQTVANDMHLSLLAIDLTTPQNRIDGEVSLSDLSQEDIVIFGVPVYIGRVPNLIVPYFKTIRANGAIGVPVVVYGNRAYDDGLIEWRDIMHDDGFRIPAAAAFVGEHSFSHVLGAKRPDAQDLLTAHQFGCDIAKVISQSDSISDFDLPLVKGNPFPYAFFKAKNSEKKGIDIRKVTPVTDLSRCNNCGYCAEICSMGAIDATDFSKITGICIKCGACVKRCPNGAKYFDNEVFLEHLHDLEAKFTPVRGAIDIVWSQSIK